ncbi:hypothetical protein MTO96_016243 [Rhipicephalus appendiculatus]
MQSRRIGCALSLPLRMSHTHRRPQRRDARRGAVAAVATEGSKCAATLINRARASVCSGGRTQTVRGCPPRVCGRTFANLEPRRARQLCHGVARPSSTRWVLALDVTARLPQLWAAAASSSSSG